MRNSKLKQAGSGTQRTVFSTHFLILTASQSYLMFKKMFPKILNTFTVKICYKGCGLENYFILYCCKQTSDSTCAAFLLPRRVYVQ